MFEIGQQVVCIWDDWGKRPLDGRGPRNPAVKGRVYTINEMYEAFARCSAADIPAGKHLFLGFDEIPEEMFMSYFFRPVRKTDISLFEELLVGPPVRAREDA